MASFQILRKGTSSIDVEPVCQISIPIKTTFSVKGKTFVYFSALYSINSLMLHK